MELQLSYAVNDGDEAEARKILRENSLLDINWKNEDDDDDWTALHSACENGHGNIVSLLLAHPDIDVNQKGNTGWTPFLTACLYGSTSCVRLLLQDGRVKVNEPNNDGYTPLWCAARYGCIDVVRWWIASGREIYLGEPRNEKNDASSIAKLVESGLDEDTKKRKDDVARLLEKFHKDHDNTRNELRQKLQITGMRNFFSTITHSHSPFFLRFPCHEARAFQRAVCRLP